MTGPKDGYGYAYNEANELVSDKKHLYEYDANGNMIKKTEVDDDGDQTVWTYAYDYENRLIQVIKSEGHETRTVTFKYDPMGRRIEKRAEELEDGKIETKTYRYYYDNEDIVAEYLTKADDGKVKTETTRYIHGPGIDEPLAVEQKRETYYYHADGLGSIVALTDKKQKVVQSYEYDSFGNMKQHGDKVKQPYAFAGREWDKEIGLYFNRARYYDPKAGRFTQKDPLLSELILDESKNNSSCDLRSAPMFPSILNLYPYASNNPHLFSDPFGYGWFDIILICDTPTLVPDQCCPSQVRYSYICRKYLCVGYYDPNTKGRSKCKGLGGIYLGEIRFKGECSNSQGIPS